MADKEHKALYVAIAAAIEATAQYDGGLIPKDSFVTIQIRTKDGTVIDSSSCAIG